MEPEGSLPCSQESSTGRYPEQDEISPYDPIFFLLDRSCQISCPFFLAWVVQNNSFKSEALCNIS
jgi:hypothetical protein